MCEAFVAMMEGHDSTEIRDELKAHARPDCLSCRGAGVEVATYDGGPRFNITADTTRRLFGVCGFEGLDVHQGTMTIVTARRGVMRALALRDLSAFERPGETFWGAPTARDHGAIEMRPCRGWSEGLTAEQLRDRIERFAAFVEAAAESGATEIRWG